MSAAILALSLWQFIVPRAVAVDPCIAAQCYYLDPDISGGTHVGTQANPFSTLTATQWSTINTALGTKDVILYCSARSASSDTDQVTSLDVEGWRRTANSSNGHRFTMDGNSWWNSSDATPNWSAYSGSSKCQLNRYNTQDRAANTDLINDWTLKGLRIHSTLAKVLSLCGNNIIVQDSEIYQDNGTSSSNTPMILIVPVADAIHEGSSAACPRMTNAPQLLNVIAHDSAGELVYGGNGGQRFNDVGGFDSGSGATFDIARSGGTYTPTLTAGGSGYVVNEKLFVLGAALGGLTGDCCHDVPQNGNDLLITITGVSGGAITTFSWVGTSTGSGTTTGVSPTKNAMGMSASTGHQNLTIAGSTLYAGGSRGGQGDIIDMKGGWVHVDIRGNDISNSLNSNDFRCIVTQGIANDGTDQDFVIERNDIHDCLGVSQGAVTAADSWGEPNGLVLRNNKIRGTTNGAAVYSNSSQSSPGIKVYSSTHYSNSAECLAGASTTWTVTDLACLSNNGNGAQLSGGGFTSDHNAFGPSGATWGGGTCTNCQSPLSATAGVDFTDPPNADFHVTGSSKLLDNGVTVAGFVDDFAGNSRTGHGTAWDIGAYER